MTPQAKPDWLGLVLRVGLFVIIGWMSVIIFSWLMISLAGLLVTSALSTFAAAAVANAITVRIYERGRLSDLGLGWTNASLREFLFGLGFAAGAAVLVVGVPVGIGMARFENAPAVE